MKYKFCAGCGVHVFSKGYLEEIGGDFVSIRVNCLDNATPEELAKAPVRHADGRNNNWMNTQEVASIL